MLDQIGSAHMKQGALTSFTKDRFGNANSALALNGGWTQLPNSKPYFNTPQFSATLWLYPMSMVTASWIPVIDVNDGCHVNTICFIISQTTTAPWLPSFEIWPTPLPKVAPISTLTSLAPNQWQFLAITYDSLGMMSIYLNGNLIATTLSPIGFTPPSILRGNNYIGKGNCVNQGYSYSYLDELRFFNVSLSSSQINEIMACSNLGFYYIFNSFSLKKKLKKDLPEDPAYSTGGRLTFYSGIL